MFNSSQSIDAHIKDKVSEGNKIMGLIRTTIRNLDVDTCTVIETFVRSHFEFSNGVWSPSLKNILR